MGERRFASRRELFKKLAARARDARWQRLSARVPAALPGQRESFAPLAVSQGLRSYARAEESYDAYNTGRFGLGCLLARRLVETESASWKSRPSTFLSATGTPTKWARPGRRDEAVHRSAGCASHPPISKSGRLLSRTLVVLASEFGRDMMTEGKPPAKK